ncbi:MAG: tetratricopeptide repeat protein [Microcoleus vaginatus WJT46-NPBG5]|jgi:tetratricopeptide (TPR) repeat protein|nr:tetratricopeptide repeat protein [Microcoleus vaginatus WJT46-NPBG5]
MAKKKRVPNTGKGFGAGTQQLMAGLVKAESLIRRKNWLQALEILQALEDRYPNEPDVLISQVNLYLEIGDIQHYQHTCERLLKIDPNNANATLGLAGSYLANFRPMLAIRTFRRFVERWPNDRRIADVNQTIAELEPKITEMVAEMGLTGEEAIELATLHEQAQCCLELGKYLECRQLEEQILERRPDFTSALNNISQAYVMEGQIEPAITTSQRVLEIDPKNYHALSNLSRYLCLSGRLDEAKQQAEQLKSIESDAADIWVKKAEAFSFLGDDQSVLDAFVGAEKTGSLETAVSSPFLYHLAAVAHLRQGNQDRARQYWQQALKINAGFGLAQSNLNDLNQPVSQRHCPWPFPLANWVSQHAVNELLEQVRSGFREDDEEAATQTTQRYLQHHPEMVSLVPMLLDRGDPPGREFALRLAKMAKTPEMLEALKDFALSDRGPDESRHEASTVVSSAGLLSAAEPVRMWMRGKWQEVLLFGFEIDDEPVGTHDPQVMKWLAAAIAALKQQNPDEAERLLQQCLEIEPDDPSLLNNLATAYEQQKRKKEAYTLRHQIHERYPDYLFARLSIASQHLATGEIEAAEELLKPLLSRQRFHVSEFAAFCTVQMELSVAKGSPEAARSWLAMFEQTYPDHPAINSWKQRLSQPTRRRGTRG